MFVCSIRVGGFVHSSRSGFKSLFKALEIIFGSGIKRCETESIFLYLFSKLQSI